MTPGSRQIVDRPTEEHIMTTRPTLIFACTVALVIGSASGAHAGIGWLEKLSGPGPFFGVMVPLTITCNPIGHEEVKTSDGGTAYTERLGERRFFTCPLPKERGELQRIVGVEAWWLWTDHNQLPYDRDVDTGVRVKAALGTLELGTSRAFKIGGAAGVAWFSGDAFDTFARVVVQPLRLTVAPLALLHPGKKELEFLKVHANANIFVGGVKASDFGATGDFEAPFEVQWQTSIEIDPFAWRH